MIYIISGLIIIFIIYLLIILFLKQSTTINDLKIRCDEATETIEILQEKQISAITKLSKPIQKQSDEKVLISLPKIKNKNLSIFELELEIVNLTSEINKIVDEENFDFNEEEKELFKLLNNNLLELKSLTKYFNEIAVTYNKKVKSIKYLMVKIIKKYNQFEFFDLTEEVEFEILKKK